MYESSGCQIIARGCQCRSRPRVWLGVVRVGPLGDLPARDRDRLAVAGFKARRGGNAPVTQT
eukprot:9504389-Lingulodinium_polyedra.AAC.1